MLTSTLVLETVAGRAAVIISCIGFWVLITYTSISFPVKCGIFGALTLLSCVEKPCSVLNLVAIERDWVRESMPVMSFLADGNTVLGHCDCCE